MDVRDCGGGRQWEPQRNNVNGGRDRKGVRGGRNPDYYKMIYGIKACKGKGAMQAFIESTGRTPSSGGKAFQRRHVA
jgi:hypothetical protein